MRAAVVESFDRSPRARVVDPPAPAGPDEVVVDVLASALHPRVRSQADGSHYAEDAVLPLVPGIDGVGRDEDGRLLYFLQIGSSRGAMAGRVVVDRRRTIELPDGADPVRVAAAMNPAMSSWVALRRRIAFEPGQSVLVLGATGSAGSLAVQVARTLGAAHVVAVGRDRRRLDASGADVTVALGDDPAAVSDALGRAGAEVDVVLDYVWGQPTADALRAIVPARVDDGQALRWVQIGSVAGTESPIPSAALRATRLELVGSGQGSVAAGDILTELRTLAGEIVRGGWTVPTRAVALADVEAAWTAPAGVERVVVVPSDEDR